MATVCGVVSGAPMGRTAQYGSKPVARARHGAKSTAPSARLSASSVRMRVKGSAMHDIPLSLADIIGALAIGAAFGALLMAFI